MRTDRPHQAKVLAWAKSRSCVAFFLAMRLGKTHIAIRWANHRSPDGLKIVVAPTTTLLTWCDELKADGQKFVMLSGSSKQKLETVDSRHKSVRWILVNPEGLRACPDILAGLALTCVILDESTFIANSKARITRLVHDRLGHVKNRAILTGTPDPEGVHQYFEQMRFVTAGREGIPWMKCFTFWVWRLRYFHKYGFDWVPHSQTEYLVKKEVAKHAYVMDSTKILGHKPVYEMRTVEMPPRLRAAYKQAWDDMELGDATTKWTPVVQSWLQQIAGGSLPKDYDCSGELYFSDHKTKALAEIVHGELKRKQVVVFFRFNRELKRARFILGEGGVIHGGTPLERRKELINKFRKGKLRVLLMQAKCARYALPLWMASAAIFFSNYWDCGTRQQLEARLHGEKRKDQPLYIDLVTRGTVDARVVRRLRKKAVSSKRFLADIREMQDDSGN